MIEHGSDGAHDRLLHSPPRPRTPQSGYQHLHAAASPGHRADVTECPRGTRSPPSSSYRVTTKAPSSPIRRHTVPSVGLRVMTPVMDRMRLIAQWVAATGPPRW